MVIKSSLNTGSVYYRKCHGLDNCNQVLKTYTTADLDTLPVPSRILISALPRCSSSTTQHVPGFWMKRDKIWHWSAYKCYFPFTFNSKLSNCLKKTKLIMFGDSHMESRNEAFRKYFHWNTKPTFTFVTIAAHLLHVLKNQTSNLLTVKQPTMVVMNCGHWSLVNMSLTRSALCLMS